MIEIDRNKIDRAINRAFDTALEALADSCQDAISSEVWEWPRATLRQNSDIVSSPRDIVDTGELYDSLRISRTANAAALTWGVDYGTAVHDGATAKNGTELPARPWTQAGIENCNTAEIMQRQLNKLL